MITTFLPRIILKFVQLYLFTLVPFLASVMWMNTGSSLSSLSPAAPFKVETRSLVGQRGTETL